MDLSPAPLITGVVVAVAVGLLGTFTRMDRDRAYYAVIAIVVAHYYPLYAVLGGSTHALLLEALTASVFLVAAIWGFKSSSWILAAALGGHGLFDLIHGRLISNPGLPPFWPAFCASFDVAIAVYLGWLLKSGRLQAALPR